MTLSDEQLRRFRRDGFLIIPDVFSAQEIEDLRQRAFTVAEETGMEPTAPMSDLGYPLPGDTGSYPEFAHLVTDERIASITRQLIGAPPVYFRDSVVAIGGRDRGWHKDNRNSDRYDTSAPDWQGDYPIVRMAIYCEDHVDHSGGLALRKGSHQPTNPLRKRLAQGLWGALNKVRPRRWIADKATGMLAAGKPIHVATRPGDLVIWTLRITHSGHTVRPRGLKNLKLPPAVESRLPAALATGEDKVRVAVFLTLGARSEHLDRFVEWLRGKEYFRGRTLERPLSPGLADEIERPDAPVGFLDPWAEERVSA
jgi:hypothetical protein